MPEPGFYAIFQIYTYMLVSEKGIISTISKITKDPGSDLSIYL